MLILLLCRYTENYVMSVDGRTGGTAAQAATERFVSSPLRYRPVKDTAVAVGGGYDCAERWRASQWRWRRFAGVAVKGVVRRAKDMRIPDVVVIFRTACGHRSHGNDEGAAVAKGRKLAATVTRTTQHNIISYHVIWWTKRCTRGPSEETIFVLTSVLPSDKIHFRLLKLPDECWPVLLKMRIFRPAVLYSRHFSRFSTIF